MHAAVPSVRADAAPAILLPVALIFLGSWADALAAPGGSVNRVLHFVGSPDVALLIAVLAALVTLGGHIQTGRHHGRELLRRLTSDSFEPIASVLVILAAAGGLSGILRDSGAAQATVSLALGAHMPPLVLAKSNPSSRSQNTDWLAIIETNVISGVRLSRYWLPKMKAAGWGRIIFISSESAVNIPVEMVHYGVTKTMQLALSRGLAETTTGTGVTVNSILVGPTRSEGVEKFIADVAKARQVTAADFEKEFFRTIRPSSIIQRFETPDEVAALVVFTARPLSSATNGAALRVDGGVVRSIL